MEYMIYTAKLLACGGIALGSVVALWTERDNRKHQKAVHFLLSSIAWSLIVIWLQQV